MFRLNIQESDIQKDGTRKCSCTVYLLDKSLVATELGNTIYFIDFSSLIVTSLRKYNNTGLRFKTTLFNNTRFGSEKLDLEVPP